MKKLISDYVKSLGGSTNYSGKSSIMYINDHQFSATKQTIVECLYNKFGFDLPFKLVTNI